MTTDINADGAIKCANATLHTTRWLGNDVPAGKNFAPARFERFLFIWHEHFPSGDEVIIHPNQADILPEFGILNALKFRSAF